MKKIKEGNHSLDIRSRQIYYKLKVTITMDSNITTIKCNLWIFRIIRMVLKMNRDRMS